MGIRTPDLLHAMRGDLVCLRRTGSDTGRSGGVDCLAVSGPVRHRLRRLPLRQSLDFQPHGKQRMSFRNAYHTDQRRRIRAPRRHSGCETAADRAAVPASANQDQQAAAIDGAEDPLSPATRRTPCILARAAVGHPRLLRRDIHVLRRPAGQPDATLNRTGAHFAGRRPRPHGASRPLLGAYRNARFCRICR